MKIVILQDFLRNGGTERQTLFLARYLQKKGEVVDLVIFKPGGHLGNQDSLAGLSTHFLQRGQSGWPLFAPRLKSTIRAIRPDLILCMGRTANCYSGFVQGAFPGVPVVSTLRTGKTLFPLHHWSLYKVKAILANSNWWKRRLMERSFDPDRVHVIHNSITMEHDGKEAAPTRNSLRDELGVPEKTTVFLNVATFRKGKRQRDLLRIFSALQKSCPENPSELWFVGDGKELKNCQAWTKKNGLEAYVRFFHYTPDPYRFYAAADVAVSTSMEDSLPNFLIESQVMGLPLIATRCRGVEECCIPGVSGEVIEPGDGERFVEQMKHFSENASLRLDYGGKAVPFARSAFSPETQAEKVWQFLKKLLS